EVAHRASAQTPLDERAQFPAFLLAHPPFAPFRRLRRSGGRFGRGRGVVARVPRGRHPSPGPRRLGERGRVLSTHDRTNPFPTPSAPLTLAGSCCELPPPRLVERLTNLGREQLTLPPPSAIRPAPSFRRRPRTGRPDP